LKTDVAFYWPSLLLRLGGMLRYYHRKAAQNTPSRITNDVFHSGCLRAVAKTSPLIGVSSRRETTQFVPPPNI